MTEVAWRGFAPRQALWGLQIISCPDMDKETQFFSAPPQATISEVARNVMILFNPDGLGMIFTSDG